MAPSLEQVPVLYFYTQAQLSAQLHARGTALTVVGLGHPQTRCAVQARLGNPVAYTGSYPLYVASAQYNVDPTVDPAVQTPIDGGG